MKPPNIIFADHMSWGDLVFRRKRKNSFQDAFEKERGLEIGGSLPAFTFTS